MGYPPQNVQMYVNNFVKKMRSCKDNPQGRIPQTCASNCWQPVPQQPVPRRKTVLSTIRDKY